MNSKTIWIIFVVLFVLHQDFWNWDNTGLVFGFMPVGLAYHAGFSLAAALLWAAALKFAWPSEIEAGADEADEQVDAASANEGGAA